MRRNTFLLHAVFASLLFVLPATASAAPNFTGNWKINASKTDVGPLPVPEKYEQKIEHKDPSLKYTINQANQMGEFSSDHVYTTDGAECKNKLRGNELKSKVTWDGDKLKFETKMEYQGAEVTFLDKWSLSADGKVLTIERHIASPQGEIDVKYVLDKQP